MIRTRKIILTPSPKQLRLLKQHADYARDALRHVGDDPAQSRPLSLVHARPFQIPQHPQNIRDNQTTSQRPEASVRRTRSITGQQDNLVSSFPAVHLNCPLLA